MTLQLLLQGPSHNAVEDDGNRNEQESGVHVVAYVEMVLLNVSHSYPAVCNIIDYLMAKGHIL